MTAGFKRACHSSPTLITSTSGKAYSVASGANIKPGFGSKARISAIAAASKASSSLRRFFNAGRSRCVRQSKPSFRIRNAALWVLVLASSTHSAGHTCCSCSCRQCCTLNAPTPGGSRLWSCVSACPMAWLSSSSLGTSQCAARVAVSSVSDCSKYPSSVSASINKPSTPATTALHLRKRACCCRCSRKVVASSCTQPR